MKPAKNKYKAIPVTDGPNRFASTKEHRYYRELLIRQRIGEVKYFLRQVGIHLNCGSRYVVDFQVFLADGSVEYVDVKGMETQVFKLKKRMVESEYPIIIKVV